MKTLVVDDDFVSRKKVEKIVNSFGECIAVESGRAAIDAYKSALENKMPFDLIALDIAMPEMDGIEVLLTIRELENEVKIPKEKQVKILMVSSHRDKDTILTCVRAGCNDFITKPFDKGTIIKKLNEFGLVVSEEIEEEEIAGEMVSAIIQDFRKGNIELPVLSQVVQAILDLLKKETSTITDLAQVIEKDAVISLKLVTIANSPIYRGSKKIQNVSMAIPRVGLKEAQSIVSAIANKSLYKTKNKYFKDLMDKLWLHSLACAYCAKALSKKITQMDAEKVFLMGLIHDIGSVLLIKSLGEIIADNKTFDKADLIDSVYEAHTSFGAALLDQWEFSQEFVTIAEFHEWTKFDSKATKELLTINLADNMTYKIGYGFFDKEEIDLSDLESKKMLEIDLETLDKIGEETKTQMKESAGIF